MKPEIDELIRDILNSSAADFSKIDATPHEISQEDIDIAVSSMLNSKIVFFEKEIFQNEMD